MAETRREFYTRMVAEQEQWIKSCGGSLAGYIATYGSADDPNRTGDGGEAIYRADSRRLAGFKEQLGRTKLKA